MFTLYVATLLWATVALALAVVWRRQRSVAAATVGTARHVVVMPPANDPVGRVVSVLRRKKWARRGLSGVSIGLLIGAVVMLGYPVYTNFYADRKQAELERELASPELRQAYLEGRIGVGDALTRIKIPRLDVDVVVVEGVSDSALRAGAGHYPDTALPCTDGNVAIAGHRTTYGRPFRNVDLLRAGDVVILETPIGSCTYEVSKAPFAVFPGDYHVVDQNQKATLTLTTCHPPGSASQRLIIKATRVRGQAVKT